MSRLTERERLAVLGREYLLAGHLIDRATMPFIIARWGQEAMTRLAIEEWMGASPVYTRRMQRAMNFVGDDVATIFKGLQLDVGAPHQFLDFQFELHDDLSGEFWLEHCGALMDVEPMGETFVVSMCHDIEDPTFDATAVATNARAQVRPIHRPPRVPSGRTPHCRWTVRIVPDAEPVTESANCLLVAQSLAATLRFPAVSQETAGTDASDGGWVDYGGAFDPAFQLEKLSTPALHTVLDEFSLQGHLLVRSMGIALTQHADADTAADLTRRQFRGIAPVVAGRIRDAVGLSGGGLGVVAEVLRLHPAFRPASYVDLRVDTDDDHLRIALGHSPAFEEGDRHSWAAQLADDPSILDPTLEALDPRAVATSVTTSLDEVVAWEVRIDPDAEPAQPPDEVVLTRFSTGAEFVLRRPLPVAR